MNHPSSFLASSSSSSFPSRTATILSLLQQQRQQQHHPARPPPSRLSSVVSYGSETLVPPHDICRLSYYLKCCAIGCGMLPLWPPTNNNNEDPHALLDYERAHRLSVSQQQAIVQWALHHWKLESFLNRAILLDDGHVLLPHGTLNTFLEFQTVAECFPSLLTAMTSPNSSTTRSVVKVMLCTTRWMQEYYIDPFLRYMQGDLLIETYATRVRPHRAYYEEDDDEDDDYFLDDDDDYEDSRPETPLLWDEHHGGTSNRRVPNPTASRPVPDHSTAAAATAAAPLHSLLPWLDLQDAPLQPTNPPRQGQANNNINDRTNKSVQQEIVLSPNDCRAIHSGIVCQGGSNCRQRSNTTLPSDLMGPRYRCLSCQNVNLCQDCYQSACHDQTHWFECIPYEGSKPQWVPPQVVPCAAAHLLVQQGKKKRKHVSSGKSRGVQDMDRKPAAKRMKLQEKDQHHPAHDGSDSDDSCSIIPPMAVAVPLPDYVDSLLYGNDGHKAASSSSSHPHTAAATWVL